MYLNIFIYNQKFRFKIKNHILPKLIQKLKENYNVTILNGNIQNKFNE
jgi:hypothetical protein